LLALIIRIGHIDIHLIGRFLARNLSLIIILVLGFTVLLYKYYSDKKVKFLMERFDNFPLSTRRAWGFIAIISFIIPWVVFSILLSI